MASQRINGTEIDYLSGVLGEVYGCQRMFRTLPTMEELGGMMVRITRVGRQSKAKARILGIAKSFRGAVRTSFATSV
jgi:hypothetical protein